MDSSLAVLIASLIGAVLTWHLNRLLSPTDSRSRRAVRLAGASAIILVVLSAWNQFESNARSSELRRHMIDLEVGENLAARRIAILDSYINILANSVVVNNYHKYQQGIASLSLEEQRALAWKKQASPELNAALDNVRRSLEVLRKHAKEVLDLSVRYPNRVPKQMTNWAEHTMSINFENLPRFINAYDVSSDVIAYAEVLGAGTGAAIAYVRATTETLGQ